MPNYTLAKCPVCQSEFKETDDIVVCPKCGTPHHRECYKKLGHCANEQNHGKEESWYTKNKEEQETPQKDNVCSACGAENESDAEFCKKCGTALSSEDNQQNIPMNIPILIDPFFGIDPNEEIEENITVEDMTNYVQINAPYYLSVFKNIKKYGVNKFNFSAFFFSNSWLLYRKNYLLGIILSILNLISALLSWYVYFQPANSSIKQTLKTLTNYVNNPTTPFNFSAVPALDMTIIISVAIIGLIGFVSTFIIGIYGNKIYMKNCIKRIRKVKVLDIPNEEMPNMIRKKGGINMILALMSWCINPTPNFFTGFIG